MAIAKKKLVKSYLKLMYLVFSLALIISVFLPWISISASFESEVYDEYGYITYDASLIGARYHKFFNITGTITEDSFNTVAPSTVIAINLLMLVTALVLFVYGLTGLNLESIKKFEKMFESKDKLLMLTITTIQLIITMYFFLGYNSIVVVVNGEKYTISAFKNFMIEEINSVPFASVIEKDFLFDYGIGAYIALFFSMILFLISLGYVLYTDRHWGKTWVFKGSLVLVVTIATLLPWVEIFDPETLSFTIEIGFITASGLVSASLLFFILFLIDSYNQGLVSINRLYEEIYKGDLTEEEIVQRRNKIENIYKMNKLKKYAIILVGLIVLILIASTIRTYMNLYIQMDKIGGDVRSLVGLWLVWLAHLAFLISLFLFRD